MLLGTVVAVAGGACSCGWRTGASVASCTCTLASIPRGRPVFPGVGNGVAVEELFKQHGLVLRDTRMLDPVSETVVQEWGPQR